MHVLNRLAFAVVLASTLTFELDAQPRPIGLTAFASDEALKEFISSSLQRQRISMVPTPVAGCAPMSTHFEAVGTTADAIVSGSLLTGKPGVDSSLRFIAIEARPLGISTKSDADGRFSLRLPADSLIAPRPVTFVFRRLGYTPIQQVVTASKGMRVTLETPVCHFPLSINSLSSVVTAAASVSITNNQEAGVDEGDIVKRVDNYLLVLRRGRLFTVDLREQGLRAVDVVDAFGPGVDPQDAWYDELIVAGSKVIVVGYSYGRGGTELGVFELSGVGRLTHLDTYQLSSYDYYDGNNYAARLVGDHLVFYAPLSPYRTDGTNPLSLLPSMRRWRPGGDSGSFVRTASAARVFYPGPAPQSASLEALHSVTSCDLTTPRLSCQSTVVLAPEGREFYVSTNAVYLWTYELFEPVRIGVESQQVAPARLVRIPFDGSLPSATAVHGRPIDQFSFLERDGVINVFVQADDNADAGQRTLPNGAELAHLRLPLAQLTNGEAFAPDSAYRTLPLTRVVDSARAPFVPIADLALKARFVGDHLLYGETSEWGHRFFRPRPLHVTAIAGGAVESIALTHRIERIEALGRDAVVIGGAERELRFSAVRLGRHPALSHEFGLANATQGESRSHGFFYRPDSESRASGVLGLPVAGPDRLRFDELISESVSVLFLRNTGRTFEQVGSLAARTDRARPDKCKASCVDWYGNSRPVFIDNRSFALLGYELVEGKFRRGKIEEVRRINLQRYAR